MRVRRSRTLRAGAPAVWAVLADPYALPRWWPLARRVEGVSADGWTVVLGREGRPGVRADHRLEASEPERLRRWALVVPGSPFARVLAASVTEARLEAAGDGTRFTLELYQAPAGWARLGRLMLRRAARRQLDEALDGMAQCVDGDPA
jgi:uncharacterized protein YndB with AHSA1/START domain